MASESVLREAICEIGRRMVARNLVAATDGNISVRIGADRYLCTPSGVSKGFMRPADLVIADGGGEKVEGAGKVTSEFFTHLAAYEERPDVQAVVHAHPPHAVAFTLAGLSLTEPILPEVVYALGGVPTAPYATPGTRDGANAIRALIRECDALLLPRHGSITVGRDLMDAYLKLEKVEHACQTLLLGRLLGEATPLGNAEVARLHALGREYGVTGRLYRETGR